MELEFHFVAANIGHGSGLRPQRHGRCRRTAETAPSATLAYQGAPILKTPCLAIYSFTHEFVICQQLDKICRPECSPLSAAGPNRILPINAFRLNFKNRRLAQTALCRTSQKSVFGGMHLKFRIVRKVQWKTNGEFAHGLGGIAARAGYYAVVKKVSQTRLFNALYKQFSLGDGLWIAKRKSVV